MSATWTVWILVVLIKDFFQGAGGEESPALPATAGQWMWLGDSSREQCPPVLPSIKVLALVWWFLAAHVSEAERCDVFCSMDLCSTQVL